MFHRRTIDPEITRENRRSFLRSLAVVVGVMIAAPVVVPLLTSKETEPQRLVKTVVGRKPGHLTVIKPSFACSDKAEHSRILGYASDGADALAKREGDLAVMAGRCTYLNQGETVIRTQFELLRVKVRRPGDVAEFWVSRDRTE